MVDITPVFTINEIDFSDILNEVQFSVRYIKREGENGGMMKDGSMTVDVIAWKAVITVKTKGIAPSRMSELLNTIITDYVDVTFLDPRTNTERTAEFIPDAIETPIGYFADGQIGWYRSTQITLTER